VVRPEIEDLIRGWEILRHAGFVESGMLPYFRSFSRLLSEPADLVRLGRGTRSGHRAAFPELSYRLFRGRRPDVFDLFALFSLERPSAVGRLEAILGREKVRDLISCGFVHQVDGSIHPRIRIYLQGGEQVFLHDAPSCGLPFSQRAYMARDSIRFADFLDRDLGGRRFERGLDLGTGCGIQAHALARRCDSVVAIEGNERSLAYARANAMLNGVASIDFRLGDFMRPDFVRNEPTSCRGETFDLVVSNPPFLYLPRPLPGGHDPASDGGMGGITIPRRILARLPDLLRPGGEARILTSLPGWPDRPILERWIDRNLARRGFDVRLRFVEFLWRADQQDAYHARGIAVPPLVVADVRRGARTRGMITPPSPSAGEKMVLIRAEWRERARRQRERQRALTAAAGPRRLSRAIPLALDCLLRRECVSAPPLRLAIEPTTHCPLDCASCARAERVKEPRHIDPGMFGRILSQVRPRIVHLHGCGEPFAHPEARRLLADARRMGAQTAALTSLTDPDSIERAVASLEYLDRLQIGVDAVTQSVYGRVRRNGDLDQVRSGIRALVRARHRAGTRSPSIVLTFLLLERNIEEAVPFVRAAFKMGADGVVFLPVDLFTIETRERDLIGSLRGQDVAAILTKAAAAAARVGIPTNASLMLESRFLLDHRYGGGALPGRARCLRPWLSTYATVNGHVRPCSRFAYDDSSNLGNLVESSFPSIWNGAAYQLLRRGIRDRRPVHPPCSVCPGPHEEGGLLGNLRRRRKSP
jgi:MoaA/NifB/PqqE/SkfB family radical SAM enzyme/SAM-dependent methyltransferase